MSCILRRKPVPMRVDRVGTLRCVWLRAPPRSTTTNPKPRSGRWTQKTPYEGGQKARRTELRIRARRRAPLPTEPLAWARRGGRSCSSISRQWSRLAHPTEDTRSPFSLPPEEEADHDQHDADAARGKAMLHARTRDGRVEARHPVRQVVRRQIQIDR